MEKFIPEGAREEALSQLQEAVEEMELRDDISKEVNLSLDSMEEGEIMLEIVDELNKLRQSSQANPLNIPENQRERALQLAYNYDQLKEDFNDSQTEGLDTFTEQIINIYKNQKKAA